MSSAYGMCDFSSPSVEGQMQCFFSKLLVFFDEFDGSLSRFSEIMLPCLTIGLSGFSVTSTGLSLFVNFDE